MVLLQQCPAAVQGRGTLPEEAWLCLDFCPAADKDVWSLGHLGSLSGSWIPPCLAKGVLPLQTSLCWGLLLFSLMASSSSCLCPTECELVPEKCLCHLLGATSVSPGAHYLWCVTVGGVRTIPQMPNLWFPCCCNSSSFLPIPGRNGQELLHCFALTFSLFESGYLLTSVLF